jgi:beta-galactosidase
VRLTTFASAGGTLLLTFLSGSKDENNWVTQTALPGFLREATGAVIRDFDPQTDQKQEIVMADGSRYPAETWFDILTPETAEALATYAKRFYSGKAALTRNRYGRGTIYYVGFETKSDEFHRRIVAEALRDSGIAPGVLVPEGVQVASRKKPGREIFFVLNYDDEPKTVAMGHRLLNALTGKTEPESLELGPFDVKVLTPP